MNKQWLQIALGILTATGGFVDVGAVATSGTAGAQFGFGLIWAMLLATLAIMLLVWMSGRLTAVSGKTYMDAIRERFGFKFYLFPISSELIANGMMLAAEFGGMAIALSLLTGISWHYLLPVSALIVWVTIWRAPFSWIENGPALLGLITLGFVVGIVMLGGPSTDTISTLWKPPVQSGQLADYLYLAAAILGAIISPYLVYFYSSGAREEQWSRRSLVVNRATAIIGMSFGSITAISLIVLSAMVLRPLHITVGSLGEVGLPMAKAMGKVGVLIFAAALFITCFGAALEVSLSVAYEVAQGFGWEWGEDLAPAEAPRFNLLLTVYTLLALLIGFIGINPLQLTLFASMFTALVLPISLGPFLIIMNDKQYMGDQTIPRWANLALTGVLVIASAVALSSIPLVILSGGG